MTRTPWTLDAIAGQEMALLIAIHAWTTDDLAQRQALRLSTDTLRVPRNQTVEITARPQQMALRPKRLVIPAAIANHFVVHDLFIGNRSQFLRAGDIPAAMFATSEIDNFVSLETCQVAMDIRLIVTYVGPNFEGEPFNATLVGTSADDPLWHALIWTDRGAFVLDEIGTLSARRVGDAPTSVRVEKIDDEDLDRLINDLDPRSIRLLDPPHVVGLRVRDDEARRCLVGIDDTVGKVIFEIFVSATAVRATIDLDGYEPEWLTSPEADAQKQKEQRQLRARAEIPLPLQTFIAAWRQRGGARR
jgi:hypothetical protein